MRMLRTVAAGVAAAALLAAADSRAAPIYYSGGMYSQNFDSLPWSSPGARVGPWVDDATLPGWYVSGNSTLRSSDGSTSQAALFSYGSSPADRAFGSQIAFGENFHPDVHFGMSIVNQTGASLTQFTLSYVGEQWRDGGNNLLEPLMFSYAVNALSLTSGEYRRAGTLDFLTPIRSDVPTALDGNLPVNRRSLTATILGLHWAPGERLWLRWTDVDDPGSRGNSGLAVDDLVFSAGPVVSPEVMVQRLTLPQEVISTPNTSPPRVSSTANMVASNAADQASTGAMFLAEPGTAALTVLCLGGLGFVVRRRERASARS